MGGTVQMNLRIDADLKERGDAALAQAGYTPSQAVRSLWQLAVDNGDRPEVVAGVLEPRSLAAEEDERERRRAAIERGWSLCDALLRGRGIDPVRVYDDMPDDGDVREAAFQERWAERGLL